MVTGDILRPVDMNRFAGSQSGNVRWLHALLKGALTRASGLPVDAFYWDQDTDIGRLYSLAGAEKNLRGWADLSDRRDLPAAITEQIEAWFDRTLVVGFEMPRMLTLALDKLSIPYLDLTIHPVRFLEDIYFGIATNHPEIFAVLQDYAIPERHIERAADIILAHVTRRPPRIDPEAQTLILGQVEHDRALIFNGRFVNFINYAGKLQSEIGGEDKVLFKRHPYGKTDCGLLLAGTPRAKILPVTDNFYAMMAVPSLRKVVSVTSGGSFEARYFGKAGIHLGTMPTACVAPGGEFSAGAHLGIYEGFLDDDFWRRICAPVAAVGALDGDRFKRSANTLRTSLGDFWGFNEITTDRMVALAPQKA